MDFSGLMVKMVIFIILILTGYYFSKKGFAGPEFTKTASKLVIDVFMAATILNSVLKTDPNMIQVNFGEIAIVIVISMASGYLVAALAQKFFKPLKSGGGVIQLIMAVPNTMFIAMPILDQLFGSVAVFYASLSNIPFNTILFTYGIWRLKKDNGESGIKIKEIFSIPLLATLIGVVIFFAKIRMPRVVTELVSSLAGATMPMSMIVIGASLGTASIIDSFKTAKLYLLSFFKLIVTPLFVWLICSFITNDPILLISAVLLSAAPTGVIVSILSIRYNGEGFFASEGILHSTILSLITMPIFAYILNFTLV